MIGAWSTEGEVKRLIEAHGKEIKRKKSILPHVASSGYAVLGAERGFEY